MMNSRIDTFDLKHVPVHTAAILTQCGRMVETPDQVLASLS
jgi:hypothetical protein